MRIKDNRAEPVATAFGDLKVGAVFHLPDDFEFYVKIDKLETVDHYFYTALALSDFCDFACLEDNDQVIEVSATLLIDHKE